MIEDMLLAFYRHAGVAKVVASILQTWTLQRFEVVATRRGSMHQGTMYDVESACT